MSLTPLTAALGTTPAAHLDNDRALTSPMGNLAKDVQLARRLNQLSKMTAGVATVLDGTTTIEVDVGADFDGAPAQLTFASAPGAATILSYGWDGDGVLTITVDQDPTADVDVSWSVDARLASDLD